MIRLVIFDMDGLLIDSEPYWQETERKVFSEYGIEITEDMQHSTFGLRTDEQIQYWYNYKPWDNPDFSEVEDRYHETMVEFFRSEAELKEGAMEILDFISGKGLEMALASSSTLELINAFVDRFELRDKFSVLYSAENEDYGKPHPAVYISTAARFNIHPSDCLAFEDSLNGVIAARAAKMKVVAVPDDKHFDLPGYAIADMKLASLREFNEEKLGVLMSQN